MVQHKKGDQTNKGWSSAAEQCLVWSNDSVSTTQQPRSRENAPLSLGSSVLNPEYDCWNIISPLLIVRFGSNMCTGGAAFPESLTANRYKIIIRNLQINMNMNINGHFVGVMQDRTQKKEAVQAEMTSLTGTSPSGDKKLITRSRTRTYNHKECAPLGSRGQGFRGRSAEAETATAVILGILE
ncbi:hypothetical protein J6590_033827 [Homalodisca vitripennis]|nr:hypothetical protein J6590_033827 [Homalodisca vitripennis]